MVSMELLRSELLICHFTPSEPPDRILSLSHHQAIPLPVNPPPSHPLEPPDSPDLLSLFRLFCSISKIFTHPPPPTSALALLSVMLAKVAGVYYSDPSRFTAAARSLVVFNFCFGELHGISLLFHAIYSISGCFSWIWFCYPLSDMSHTKEWFIGVSIFPAVLAAVPSLVIFDSVWAAKNHAGVLFQSTSFTSQLIIIVLSSIVSPSFGHLKLSVLLLAGEGTSGSRIPVFINSHILFRRCKNLGFVYDLSIASSVLKNSLPRKLCYMVTHVFFQERVSSPSLVRAKRIVFALILSMSGELFSASKPKIFSSFMERVLLSSALMALATIVQAVYDRVVVLGLKKAYIKSTSPQISANKSLVDYLVAEVMMFGGVLFFASGNEFGIWILCSGNSASLSISKEESIHYGYSEFIMLSSLFYFILVVLV